ncbi:hypothetical protein BASA81_001288 [Batrachochytrium salamandrivorans]|nr:hypothetical protein BASA81_001288 [Batrachochytrium salamandrivorans]
MLGYLQEPAVRLANLAKQVELYQPYVLQQAWTGHPHHVSFSGSLWIDLAMVGVIYRLDELYLDFVICPGTLGSQLWVPYAYYLAVFDSFESLVILQSEYKIAGRRSMLSNVMHFCSWLCIALMGAAIPNDLSCIANQNGSVAIIFFPIFKLSHSALRWLRYVQIVFVSKLPEARPRLVACSLGLVPLIISVVLASCNFAMEAYAMLFASYAMQYLGYYLSLWWFGKGQVKTNMPFIIQRYRDWIQLQLGSIMLGMVTSLRLDLINAYGSISVLYAFLAMLDLLAFTSEPKSFANHSLVKPNALQSHVWFALFIGVGYCIMGIAVGTRYLVKVDKGLPEPIWIMVASTMGVMTCLLLQKLAHEQHLKLRYELRTRKRALLAFTLAIATCIICAFLATGEDQGVWVGLNLFLSTALVLVIHTYNGGFQRELTRRSHRIKLRGQVLAMLIGKAWLQRARQTIAERELKSSKRRRRTLEALYNASTPSEEDQGTEDNSNEVCMENDDDEEDGKTPIPIPGTLVKLWDSENVLPRQTVAVKVLKKLVLDRFYVKSTFLVPHDMFADYLVSWSDLFFDVVYVTVLYKLGYYLVDGLGLGAHLALSNQEKSSAVFDFVCLFVAVFHLWFVKLNYTSKVKSRDVLHMVVDVLLGYFVLQCAVSISSPQSMAENWSQQYWITGMLTGYHVTMLLLWTEAFFTLGKDSWIHHQSSHKCAVRNIKRQLLSLVALVIGFFVVGMHCPLPVVCFFWLCSYLFPLFQRIEDLTQQPWVNEAPFLLRYVVHRLGDFSLMVLGEGVLQIIRSVSLTTSSADIFLTFTLAFSNMALCRIAMFYLDCVDGAVNKHAVLQPQKAYSLIISVLRIMFSGPSVVSFGVSLKLVLQSEDNEAFSLAGISASLSMLCFILTYHLHRTAYFKGSVDYKRLALGVVQSMLFLCFPWIPNLSRNWFLVCLMGVWIINLWFHSLVDDFLHTPQDNQTLVTLPVLQVHESIPAVIPVSNAKSKLERQKSMRQWSSEVSRFQQQGEEEEEEELLSIAIKQQDLQMV